MPITCGRLFEGAERLVFGTDSGVYLANRAGQHVYGEPTQKLNIRLATQLEVLEQHHLLLVLADNCLYAYSLDTLLIDQDPSSSLKRGTRICFCNYVGVSAIDTQQTVCCVKSSAVESVTKFFGLVDCVMDFKKELGWNRVLSGEQDLLRLRTEVSIPMRVHSLFFAGSKVYVGGTTGLQVISLETFETQSLLDPLDATLDCVTGKENTKPVYIERNGHGLLLCCSDISIYVPDEGHRAWRNWKIEWSESPKSFATLADEYIVAFKQGAFEVRASATGAVVSGQAYGDIMLLQRGTSEVSRGSKTEMNLGTLLTHRAYRSCSHTRTRQAIILSLHCRLIEEVQVTRDYHQTNSLCFHSQELRTVFDGQVVLNPEQITTQGMLSASMLVFDEGDSSLMLASSDSNSRRRAPMSSTKEYLASARLPSILPLCIPLLEPVSVVV